MNNLNVFIIRYLIQRKAEYCVSHTKMRLFAVHLNRTVFISFPLSDNDVDGDSVDCGLTENTVGPFSRIFQQATEIQSVFVPAKRVSNITDFRA